MLALDYAAPTRQLASTRPHAAPVAPTLAKSLDERFTLVPLRGGLWRLTRHDGEVLGYVEQLDTPQGRRYLAKRVSPRLRRFVSLGEFWRMDEAVDCFIAH